MCNRYYKTIELEQFLYLLLFNNQGLFSTNDPKSDLSSFYLLLFGSIKQYIHKRVPINYFNFASD